MLGQIEQEQQHIVLADFEAGLGTLSRLKPTYVDWLLVVVEPTAKAVDVAQRALAMIRERDLARSIVIGNRIDGDADRAFLEGALAGETLLVVPEDAGVRDAALRGVAPFDAVPHGPAVRTLRQFASAVTAELRP